MNRIANLDLKRIISVWMITTLILMFAGCGMPQPANMSEEVASSAEYRQSGEEMDISSEN